VYENSKRYREERLIVLSDPHMSCFRPLVVACIPAYNEERTIAGVVVKTMRYVDRVVVCVDGSGDLTGDIAEALGGVVVRHEGNRGKGFKDV